MLLFNQCLAFILALVIAIEFNAERGETALEKKPTILGRSTGAASELCEAARILQPLSEIGELGDDTRFVSHDATAPKSFRTLEARQKGDSTEARFIGDDARTEGMIEIPIRTIRGVRHYATSAQYYAVFFGDGENSERVAYALRGPISGSALDASKARVERLDSLNNEDIRALGNTRTRFYMLIRDQEGSGTLRSFELENDISENRRVPLTLKIGEHSAAAFDVSSFMYNYLLIADTNSFHVIDLRREVPRVYSVGIDSNAKPHPDIQIRDSGSKERHFFVAYENGVIQRFVFILEDISQNPPIEPLVKQADNIQLDGPAHILGLDSFMSELIVASHVKGTLLLVGVAKTLSVVDTLHDDGIEIIKSPVRYLRNEHQAGVILEVKRDGRLYQYAQEIRITPCFISAFYPLTAGSKEETQHFGYGILSTGNDFDLSSSVQYSQDNGSTWHDYNSGALVNTLETGFFRRSNVCANKEACIHKYIEDPSFLLLLNSNVVRIFTHTKSEESSKWYWRILAENIEGRSYSGVARNIHDTTDPSDATSKVSSSLQPTKTSSSPSGSISSSEIPVTTSPILPPDTECNTGSQLWWNMNEYSHDWNPKAYGSIIQGQTENDFIFANGTTHALPDNSSVTYWTGALWYRPYSGGDGPAKLDSFPWMNFSNPILTLSANGSGNITFEVSWYNGEREASNTAKRVAVLDWNSSSISEADPHGTYLITPTFFGREYVSPGFFQTETYPNSYPKEFIDWIDASLRGWFYTSGAGLDYKKPPLPFRVQLLTTSSCQTTSASSDPAPSETISSDSASSEPIPTEIIPSEPTSSSTSTSATSSLKPSLDPGSDNKTTPGECEAYRVFSEDARYGPYSSETERWVSRLSDARPPVYRNAQLISMGDKNYRLSFYGGGKITTGHVDIKMSSVKLIGHIYERTNVGTVISVVVHGTASDNADELVTYLIRGRISGEEINASDFTTRRIEGFDGMDMRAFLGSQRYGASNNQILALSRNEQGKLLGLTLSPGPLTVSEPVDTGFVLTESSTILYDVTPERKFFVAAYDPRTGLFGVKDMSVASPPVAVSFTGATLAKGNIVAVTGTYEPGLMSIPATRRYFLTLEDGRVLSVDYNPKSGLKMVAGTHLDPSSVLLGGDESSSDVYAFIPSKEQIAVLRPETTRNSLVERFDIPGIKLLEETALKSPDKLFSGIYVDGVQDGNLVQYTLSVRSTPCFIFAIRDNFLTAEVGTRVPVTYRVFAPVSPTENTVSYSLQYSNDFGDTWFTQDQNKEVPTHVDTGVQDPSNICGSSQNCQMRRIGDVTPYSEGTYTGAGTTWIEITTEILPRYWRVVATNALGKTVSNTRFRKEYSKPESSSISSSAAPSSSLEPEPESSSFIPSSSLEPDIIPSKSASSSTSTSATSSIKPSLDPGSDNKTTPGECEAYRVFSEDARYGPYSSETERWVSRLSDARPPVYRNAQLISMGNKNYRLSFYGGGKITTGHVDIKMSSVKLIGHIYERTNVGTVISVVVHGTASDNADELVTYLIRGRISGEEINASDFTTRRIEGFDGMDMRAFLGSQRYGASNNQILALSRNEQGKLLGLTLSPGPLTVSEPVDTGFVLTESSTILYDVTPERKFFVAAYDPRTGLFGVKDMSVASPPVAVSFTGATLAKGNIVAVTGTYEPGLMSIPATRRYFLTLEDGRVLSVDYNPKSGLKMVAGTHLDPSSVLLGGDESSSDVYAFIPSKEQIAVLRPETTRNSLVERFDIPGIKLLEETALKSPDKLFSGIYVDGVQDGNLVQYTLSVRSTPCFIFAIRDNFLTAEVGTRVPVTYRVFAPVSPTENTVSYSLQYSNDFGDTWFTQDQNKEVPTHVDTGVQDPSNICGSSQNCQMRRIGDVTPYSEGTYTGAGTTWIEITTEILPRYWRVVATNALGKTVSNTRFRKEYSKPESSSISSSAAPTSSPEPEPESSSAVPSSSATSSEVTSTSPSPSPSPNTEIASIVWTPRESWTNYIQSSTAGSSGVIVTANGVVTTDNATFRFPALGRREDGNIVLAGTGILTYYKYCFGGRPCVLNSTFVDPKVVLVPGDTGSYLEFTLYYRETSKVGVTHGPLTVKFADLLFDNAERVEDDRLVKRAEGGKIISLSNLRVNLTSEGQLAFGGGYEDGDMGTLNVVYSEKLEADSASSSTLPSSSSKSESTSALPSSSSESESTSALPSSSSESESTSAPLSSSESESSSAIPSSSSSDETSSSQPPEPSESSVPRPYDVGPNILQWRFRESWVSYIMDRGGKEYVVGGGATGGNGIIDYPSEASRDNDYINVTSHGYQGVIKYCQNFDDPSTCILHNIFDSPRVDYNPNGESYLYVNQSYGTVAQMYKLQQPGFINLANLKFDQATRYVEDGIVFWEPVTIHLRPEWEVVFNYEYGGTERGDYIGNLTFSYPLELEQDDSGIVSSSTDSSTSETESSSAPPSSSSESESITVPPTSSSESESSSVPSTSPSESESITAPPTSSSESESSTAPPTSSSESEVSTAPPSSSSTDESSSSKPPEPSESSVPRPYDVGPNILQWRFRESWVSYIIDRGGKEYVVGGGATGGNGIIDYPSEASRDNDYINVTSHGYQGVIKYCQNFDDPSTCILHNIFDSPRVDYNPNGESYLYVNQSYGTVAQMYQLQQPGFINLANLKFDQATRYVEDGIVFWEPVTIHLRPEWEVVFNYEYGSTERGDYIGNLTFSYPLELEQDDSGISSSSSVSSTSEAESSSAPPSSSSESESSSSLPSSSSESESSSAPPSSSSESESGSALPSSSESESSSATSSAVTPTSASPSPSPNTEIASIVWTPRESWTNYIQSSTAGSSGVIVTANGVVTTDNATFRFPALGRREDGNIVLAGTGILTYYKYCFGGRPCVLNSTFVDPKVVLVPGDIGSYLEFTLYYRETSKVGVTHGPLTVKFADLLFDNAERVEEDRLVKRAEGGKIISLSNLRVNLTSEGRLAFGGGYEDGDMGTLNVVYSEKLEDDSASSSTLPSSSSESESITVPPTSSSESESSIAPPTSSSEYESSSAVLSSSVVLSSSSSTESTSTVTSSSLVPTPTSLPGQDVADIIWTPRESWTNMILSEIAGSRGEVNIDRGVITSDNRTFTFPADGASDERGNIVLTGEGTLTYSKYCAGPCILNSTFVDPKVVIVPGETGSYLEFTLYYREVDRPGVSQGPFTVKFADLLFDNATRVVENELVKRSDTGKIVSVSNIRVNLTSDGRQAFGGSYEDGDMGVLAVRYPRALEEDDVPSTSHSDGSASTASPTESHSDGSIPTDSPTESHSDGSEPSSSAGDVTPTDTKKSISVTTTVVTAYTTYCPDPTTFVEGTSTYTVTEPTTLTITDCPCTLTYTLPKPTPSGSEVPKPAPSGSEAPKPTPSGSEVPKPAPSGSEVPKPTPSGSEAPKPAPSGSEVPKPTPSGSEAPKPAPSESEAPKPATSGSEAPKPAPSGQTSEAPKPAPSGEPDIPVPKGSGSAISLNVALALAAFALFWF